jgi:protein-tyrosine phosphatase
MNDLPEPCFVDIHCHVLPAIDDGARDWETTLAMSRQWTAEGVGWVIATPHQLGRYQHVSADAIRALTRQTQEELREAGIPLTVLPGAEARIHESLPALIREGKVLTLGDHGRHLLLELPREQTLPLNSLLRELCRAGIQCILAHPERNRVLIGHPDTVRSWVERGCLVQVTAGSILERFGPESLRASRQLLEAGLVHFVASDAHDLANRRPEMRKAYDRVCRWVGSECARAVFWDHPRAVALGEFVRISAPSKIANARGRSWLSATARAFLMW